MFRGKRYASVLLLLGLTNLSGCANPFKCRKDSCEPCAQECCEEQPCGECKRCCDGGLAHRAGWAMCGWMWRKSNAIPDTLPLGSTVRAHDQVMQTNAEASDFIIHQMEFVGQTAELTSHGKDHLLEIAARMRSAPFPVIVERQENNSDPELDALRRNLVAQILTDLGNPDAQQRTIVGTPYSQGYIGTRGERMYYQHIYGGGFGNAGFGGGGFGGGFGGGGAGAGGGFF